MYSIPHLHDSVGIIVIATFRNTAFRHNFIDKFQQCTSVHSSECIHRLPWKPFQNKHWNRWINALHLLSAASPVSQCIPPTTQGHMVSSNTVVLLHHRGEPLKLSDTQRESVPCQSSCGVICVYFIIGPLAWLYMQFRYQETCFSFNNICVHYPNKKNKNIVMQNWIIFTFQISFMITLFGRFWFTLQGYLYVECLDKISDSQKQRFNISRSLK